MSSHCYAIESLLNRVFPCLSWIYLEYSPLELTDQQIINHILLIMKETFGFLPELCLSQFLKKYSFPLRFLIDTNRNDRLSLNFSNTYEFVSNIGHIYKITCSVIVRIWWLYPVCLFVNAHVKTYLNICLFYSDKSCFKPYSSMNFTTEAGRDQILAENSM